jgi:hypothetical protein
LAAVALAIVALLAIDVYEKETADIYAFDIKGIRECSNNLENKMALDTASMPVAVRCFSCDSDGKASK